MAGKGDRNRSFSEGYRKGWDKIFGNKKDEPPKPKKYCEMCGQEIEDEKGGRKEMKCKFCNKEDSIINGLCQECWEERNERT